MQSRFQQTKTLIYFRIILLLFCLSSVIPQAQAQSELFTSQPNNTIWSPLSAFEIDTLNNAHLAKTGDPDALLALAIMASGDVRSSKEFNDIKSKIYQFLTRIKPRLSSQKNSWQQGYVLHSAMHDEFFLTNQPRGELSGYRANQSQFTRIFTDRTYNCISSSMLFLILARYFDLQVEGVVLPSHSYVQLTTPERQVVEIETTSKTGYGIRHNKAFYEGNAGQLNAQNWFQSRNLIPTSYQDYLKREVVSGYDLIVDNMNHQHTAQDKMSQADRYRLQEVRGWLLPNNPEALLFRFYVINNELIRLRKNKQKDHIKLLIEKAESLISFYNQNEIFSLIEKVHPIIAFIYTSKAGIAFEEENYNEAIENFKESTRWFRDQSQVAKIVRNIVIMQLNQANKLSSKKDFASAIIWYEQAYTTLNKNTLDNSHSSAQDKELSNKIDQNLGTAFWNMAVPLLNKGDSYSAYEILNSCRTRYPHLDKCRQGIDKICTTYSLPVCSTD